MTRRVVITGLGPVSGLGLGPEPNGAAVREARCAFAPIRSFDATGFRCAIASEVPQFAIRDYVPKSYRKATKVMARDIELAVVAADFAARDAGLKTPATSDDGKVSAEPGRVGCHIGAGLIAAELNELTSALSNARDDKGNFDIHRWGREGMGHLTPLWLLKYLPNMLACHVTIVHDAQGPSNTITCGEASSLLSIGESLRVIQRDDADACFCGGAESKINPMGLLRQTFANRLVEHATTDDPAKAVRPWDNTAAGTVLGEGGGILILENETTWQNRGGPKAYARLLGFGASQSVNREARNLLPEPDGRGIAAACRNALRDAQVSPNDVDLVMGFGTGIPAIDRAEASALAAVFGDRLAKLRVVSLKPLLGACGAGGGGLDVCVAAAAIHDQMLPPIVNRDQPIAALGSSRPAEPGEIRHALVYTTAMGGHNAALVLGRV